MNWREMLPFVTVVVMILLTFDVFRRYFVHQGAHRYLLFWGIGLAMFTLASLSEGILGLFWNEVAFRSWFLFGAILSAAWIGQGTVYLLFRRPWVNWVTAALVVASIFVAVWLWLTPVNAAAFKPGVPIGNQYRDILTNIGLRLMAIPFNTYGTIAIVGGALWSGFLFWRKRVLPNRVIGNVLIAAGAIAIASASSLASLGLGDYLALGQLLFAILIYAGFIEASKPAAVERPAEGAQPIRAG